MNSPAVAQGSPLSFWLPLLFLLERDAPVGPFQIDVQGLAQSVVPQLVALDQGSTVAKGPILKTIFNIAKDVNAMHHRLRIWSALALAAATLLNGSVWAQDYGDVSRGAALATRVCVACHGVRHGENSTNLLAPPFAAIAASRGMSEMALNVALLSPHRAMPNIMLDSQERADVIAYILSLKSK